MDRVRFMHTLGHDTDARQDLEEIMIIDPNDTAPIMMTGNLLYDQARYEESIVYFERALAINQNDAHIWLRKGDADLEISIKEMQKIREKYRTLTANSQFAAPSSDASTMDAFRSTEHYRDAMESYNKAIKIDPFMSVTISSHILASTQTLLNAYEGILNDMGSGNATSI
jgi:tetratricopeptide (TPR) repeat protein